MARKPRIHFSDAVYHVILKGLENESIFKNVADRRAWEVLVEEGADRFGHKVLAYCWAKDHVQMRIAHMTNNVYPENRMRYSSEPRHCFPTSPC